MTNNLTCFIVVCVKDSPETKGLSAVLKNQADILLPLSQSWQDLRLQFPGKWQPHQNFSKINTALHLQLVVMTGKQSFLVAVILIYQQMLQ